MPLQKSFSETNHSGKENHSRQPWQRNKNYQNQQQKPKVPAKPLAEKPPVPVSTTTKNILSNFQYREQSGKGDDSKEIINLVSSETDSRIATPSKMRRRGSSKDETSSVDEDVFLDDSTSADVPSTPSMGFDPTQNADFKRPFKAVSPDDRIIWDTNKDSQQLPESESGNLGKRKRGDNDIGRAQSSSPILAHSSQADSFPRPGPEVEVWMKLGQTKDIKLSRIMENASPQSSKDGNTPRGLTRSRSLGNPLNLKRHQPSRIGNSRNIDTPGLMRRLQEDYKPNEVSSGPSSSSPLPDKVQFQFEGPSSPLGRKGSEKRTSPLKRRLEPPSSPSTNIESHVALPSPKRPSTAESDYGSDDGLDEIGGMILTAIESQSQVPAASMSRPLPKIYESPIKPRAYSTHKPQSLSKSPDPPKALEDDSSDEFGEGLDDDDFDAAFAGSVPADDVELPPSRPRGAATKKEESDDEYGDDIDDSDFAAAEIAATQSLKQSTNSLMPSMEKARAIQRYLVTMIDNNQYAGVNGKLQPEKILYLQPERSKIKRMVYLRGTWIDTPVTTKAFVHIIGKFDAQGICVIDDNSGLIILHPDHLISALVVADSFGCTRRAVLQDRVKATGEASPAMLYGTILHEIFQAAMLVNRWDRMFLGELIDKLAQRHLEDLYVIKVEIPQAVEYLHSKMGELQAWAELFVSSQPKPGALVKAGNGDTVAMCVSNLLDVEEHVWSPMYGLKGNIDATVKTGKNPSVANRAQTALYNLLISDRYDVEIAYGILYYMETSETIRIPAIRHELRHMIMQRNELACYVREKNAQLPPMLKKENMCGRCYAKNTCFIYHKLADDGNGETSGMKEKFDEVVKHLTPKHKEFFLKWDDLLTKEEKDSLKFRRELWTMLSSEREKLGRCFSNVIIEEGSAYEDQNNEKINRYRYTMIKPKNTAAPGFSFMDSQIIVGEPIVISDEKGHFALAKGYVTNVRKNRITVAVDRRLHNARIRQPGFDETNNQVFASIMEVAAEGSTPADSIGKIREDPILYRLDKDEFSNGLATVRNNLIQIMTEGPFGSREIRSLVVDLNPPRFKPHSTQYTLKDRSCINVDQRRAIEKVMSAQDYALVLGMPGTGKTTTIAHIIRALVSQGKSVLLTSYTHTAVDNILLKLRDDSIPILRLGTKAKIHPDVQEFAKLAVDPKETMEEIRSVWHDTPIIATSCLGINHPIFNERTFDYCIVDEASQITLPVCVVKDEEARKGGLDISLFKYLSDAHPQSVVYLEHQYRMNADVMALSNTLIYNGRLKCGSTSVANRKIIIPDMDALKANHHTPSSVLHSTQKSICLEPKKGRCWLRDLLDPDVTVAFVDTDSLGDMARESEKGNRTVNDVEARIVTQLVTSLIAVGVDPTEIGVMTHYRSQLALLKDSLRNAKGVEMHTADRFQGRDKEVIVLSLVRSNEGGSIGELLKDWRRINVAFTRAKTKLLVVGSRGTLKGKGDNDGDRKEEMVSRFVRLMEEKKWVYELKEEQLMGHWWEMAGTATQGSVGLSQWVKVEKEVVKRKNSDLMDIEGDEVGDKENVRMTPTKQEPTAMKSGKGKHQPKRIKGGLTANNGNIRQGSVLMDLVNDMS
ncbi:DNA replication factor Dna2 [Botrytis cinerea]